MSSAPSSSIDTPPPFVKWRWLLPQSSSAQLDLPTAPVTATTSTTWQALTEAESEQCEAEWNTLTDDERAAAEELAAGGISDADGDSDPNDDDDEGLVGITIGEDKLFEVNVRTMTLKPIYWRFSAPPIRVTRAVWMYDEHRPVESDLARDLEAAYLAVKPWRQAYDLELQAALDLGAEAHEKLTVLLPNHGSSTVVFEDGSTARLLSNTLARRVFELASMSFRTTTTKASFTAAYGSATVIYRGYEAATASKGASPGPSRGSSPLPGDPAKIWVSPKSEERRVKREDHKKHERNGSRHSQKPRGGTPPVGNDTPDDVTDLILIIHGIGQGLATQYEAFNFVYAANLFRQVARKQSTQPALASIMRNGRVQFLPVQWRANFSMTDEEEHAREHEGLDNRFSLSDITLKNHIPFIRELTNNVLIDIPYFMSHHQDRMIQSVCQEANLLYRRWCLRNPHFEKNGRVHIIGHSLGSALATYILSKQPTLQRPLSQMDPESVKSVQDRFLFNTSQLFFVGSPLGVFLHINRSQLIARKGRERTMNSPPDEALDREGVFGCLAVDSIYNVFNLSDPIVYLLNPCVDAKRAKELAPSAISSLNASMFTSFSAHITKMFDGLYLPGFRPTSPIGSGSKSPPDRPSVGPRAPSNYELGGPVEMLEGTRAERRFLALNPHGTLDFYLPVEGKLGEYVEMITAHASYWADSNFAAFVLAEIFAKKEDRARTGLGPGLATPHAKNIEVLNM